MKKLKLLVNDKSKDTSRIPGTNLYVSNTNFDDSWKYKVKLSQKQSIVGFKKFGTIGIGFLEEVDGNTNLPSSTSAEEIYNHIKVNKLDRKIKKETCIAAIRLIQNARLRDLMDQTIKSLKENPSDERKLAILSIYLRQSGSHEVANVFDQEDRFWKQKATL